MKKVLIIEDDVLFAGTLSKTLSTQFQPLLASSGMEGIRIAIDEKPDLIMIDVNMPEMDGFSVCEELRKKPATSEIPIVFLTGDTNLSSRVRGLDAGADDYIAKPFHPQELLARIRARLRRRDSELKGQDLIELGNLKLDPKAAQVWVDGELVALTQVETQVLRYFLTFPNELISRERLLGDLWPNSVVTNRTVDTHMAHLRKKLQKFSCKLKTVFRGGYKLEVL